VNAPLTGMFGLPFGGCAESGIGRELAFDVLRPCGGTKTVLCHAGEKPIQPFGV